jgi:hypothetical protein
MTISYDR